MGLRSSSLKLESVSAPKILKIYLPKSMISVEILDQSLTVSSLISSLNKKIYNKYPIISLKTLNNYEILDYWLSLPEKFLAPLESEDELLAVFYTSVPKKICCRTFEILKTIGKGAYSIVTLVRKKDTGILYAMKSVEKFKALKSSTVAQLVAEKEILSKVDHPFVAKMHWAFHTRNKFHIILDYYPGGELFFHLKKVRSFSEDQSRFYFAEILLGIEHLHEKKIAYRDLKPENIVIDIDGHVRLTDFGLSKIEDNECSNSFCGSPEYMSPEMIKGSGHNKMVDFYSLGALLYEMLVGLPPFYDKDQHKMSSRILNDQISVPDYLSTDAKSLLISLLEKDPQKRLGKVLGVKEIMSHPWCEGIKWKKYKQKAINPPFVPDLRKSNIDKSYKEIKINPIYFSDTEPDENDPFNRIEFNTLVNRNSISKEYFESNLKTRTLSDEKNNLRKVHKLNLLPNKFHQSTSLYSSPITSPKSSMLSTNNFISKNSMDAKPKLMSTQNPKFFNNSLQFNQVKRETKRFNFRFLDLDENK